MRVVDDFSIENVVKKDGHIYIEGLITKSHEEAIKMKEYKIGDTIEIPERYQKEFFQWQRERVAMQRMIESLSSRIMKNEDNFWRVVSEVFPETGEWILSYSSSNRTILFLRKMTEEEKRDRDAWRKNEI